MDATRKREIAWAIVRLILGVIQIVGATAGLVFLIGTGASRITFAVAAVTGLFAVLSRILFRRTGDGTSKAGSGLTKRFFPFG